MTVKELISLLSEEDRMRDVALEVDGALCLDFFVRCENGVVYIYDTI